MDGSDADPTSSRAQELALPAETSGQQLALIQEDRPSNTKPAPAPKHVQEHPSLDDDFMTPDQEIMGRWEAREIVQCDQIQSDEMVGAMRQNPAIPKYIAPGAHSQSLWKIRQAAIINPVGGNEVKYEDATGTMITIKLEEDRNNVTNLNWYENGVLYSQKLTSVKVDQDGLTLHGVGTSTGPWKGNRTSTAKKDEASKIQKILELVRHQRARPEKPSFRNSHEHVRRAKPYEAPGSPQGSPQGAHHGSRMSSHSPSQPRGTPSHPSRPSRPSQR